MKTISYTRAAALCLGLLVTGPLLKAQTPWGLSDDFEVSENYAVGNLHGQSGWSVESGAAAVIQDGIPGGQAAALSGAEPVSRIVKTVSPPSYETVLFVEFFARFSARPLPDAVSLDEEDVFHLVLDPSGRLHAFDGDGAGSGNWHPLGSQLALTPDGVTESWVLVTVRVDLNAREIDVFIDSRLAATGLGFLDDSVDAFSRLVLEGGTDGTAYYDSLYVGSENPLFPDTMREGLPDSWKLAHGFSLDSAIRDADPDQDGLTNIEEYFFAADPLAPDTSRDGLTDGEAVSLGLNPLAAENTFPVVLPFHEDFEYWPQGDIHGRGGWIVTSGSARVQSAVAWGGAQALRLHSDEAISQARIDAEENSAQVVWTDFHLRPTPRTTGGHPALQTDTTAGFYFSEQGEVVVFDGAAAEWRAIRPVRSIDISDWVRVTVRQDYTSQTWSIWCNGVRVAKDLGFASSGNRFRSLSLVEPARSGGAYLDDLLIDFQEPAALRNFADGLTNAERIALGLDPETPDTSGDGMWDGEKIQWGLDPFLMDDFVRLIPDGEGRLSWSTSFEELEGYFTGSLIGQSGWLGSGDASVTESAASDGEQLLEVSTLDNTTGSPASAHRFVGLEDASAVWVTMDARLRPGNLPDVTEIQNRSSALVAVNASGFLYGYDGDRGRWVNSGYLLEDEDWKRLDFYIDYHSGLWSLCVEKVMVLRDLGVRDRSLLTLTRIKLTGARSHSSGAPPSAFDHIRIAFDEPAGLDFSGDGMTNDEKRALGLDIYKVDTTGDGLPDWWLVQHGFDPFDTTVGERDEDGDGLTNRQEFTVGSDPGDTDGDGDGWDDFQEYLAGTNPADALDFPSTIDPLIWTSHEINVRRSGGAYRVGDEIRIVTDARDVTGVTDGLHYLAREISGDFDFSARVDSLSNIDPWSPPIARGARAGLMVRESMNPGSRFAVISLTPVRYYFRGRSEADTFTDFNFSRNPPVPFREGIDEPTHFPSWIKLKRRGSLISGYRSLDGENWVIVGSWTISLPQTVYVGMMTASGLNHQFARGTFSDIQMRLGGDDPGYWEQADVVVEAAPMSRVSGSSYVDSIGEWQRTGESVFARTIRGSLAYSIPLANDGPYVLEIAGGEHNPYSANETFPLVVSVNGQEAGRPVLIAPEGSSGTVRIFLPYLREGSHLVTIEWRNGVPNSVLRVDEVRLLPVEGEDTDENGIPDWFESRLADIASLDETEATSLVSPFPLEGRSLYLNMLEITGYSDPEEPAEPVEIVPALFGHYYADVPLDPSGPTDILVSEQGVLDLSKTVTWNAVNILETLEEEFTVRRGASMRFTATNAPSHANPNHPITVFLAPLAAPEQVEEFTGIASEPVILTFEEDGDYIVAGRVAQSGSPHNNGFVTVRVIGADLGPSPSTVIGHVRNWTIPFLADEIELEWDSHVFLAESFRDGGARSYRISSREDRTGRIIARLGEGGPIVASTPVRAIRDDSHAYTTWNVIEQFSDGSFMVEAVISLGEVPDDLEIHLNIFRAGVLFDDGTTERIVTAADFDASGVYRYRLLQSPETIGAACHEVVIYQGGELIGQR